MDAPLVSPSGISENPSPSGEVLFAIGSKTLSLLPPSRGEGWDEGDGGLLVHPHPYPPPSLEGEGILGRVKSTWVFKPLAFKARVV